MRDVQILPTPLTIFVFDAGLRGDGHLGGVYLHSDVVIRFLLFAFLYSVTNQRAEFFRVRDRAFYLAEFPEGLLGPKTT